MKNLIIILILFAVMASCASKREAISTPEMTGTIDVPQRSQSYLYAKANRWIVTTFDEPKLVVQFSDKEEGLVIGKYLIFATDREDKKCPMIYSTFNINTKDGSARIVIDKNSYFAGGRERRFKEYKSDVYTKKSRTLINNFRNYMANESAVNW